jgi:cathepsin E
MVAASFLSTLFLALAVAAGPVEKKASESCAQLRFTKHFKAGSGNIAKQDRLRLKNFKDQGLKNRAVVSSEAENRAITYVASVGVGSPATNCK